MCCKRAGPTRLSQLTVRFEADPDVEDAVDHEEHAGHRGPRGADEAGRPHHGDAPGAFCR